jgi:hypothetical protein
MGFFDCHITTKTLTIWTFQIKSLCSLSLWSRYIGNFLSKGHGIKCGVIGNNLGNILGASKDIVNEGSSFEHVNQVGRTYTFGIEYF